MCLILDRYAFNLAATFMTWFRAAISAHSAFLDALNKIALFASQSKGGCEDLGKLLCRLVDEEKNIDMLKASAVT